MVTVGFAASIFGAIVAAAPPAPADKIAILPSVSAGLDGTPAREQVVDAVASAAAMRLNLEIAPPESVFGGGGQALDSRVRSCGSDMSCVATSLRAAGVELGLMVNVTTVMPLPFVSLHLIRAGKGQPIGEHAFEAKAAELTEAIRAAAAKLLDDAGYAIGGQIVVEVMPSDATVTVGDRVLQGSGELVVPAGRYTVTATREGFEDATETIVVLTGQPARVVLTPEEIPTLVDSPWFWIAVGTAVAGGVAAATALSYEPDLCVCVTTSKGTCGACP